MKKIVFLDRVTFAPSVNLTKPEFAHQWVEYDNTKPEEIVERCSDAHIVITNKVPLKGETLKALKNLEFIAVAATGYDCIDIAGCQAQNISVANVKDYAETTVPEHVFGLIFALRRALVGYRNDVINHEWQKSGLFCFHTHSITDLKGSTLGIIGRGTLGKAVGEIAKAFGMNVIYAARKGATEVKDSYVDFAEFLKQADIISLNCPLTESTKNLLGSEEFAAMEKHPLIINCGRGGLVDEVAIVNALKSGQISGLGFDCLTSEPMLDKHPFAEILTLPNVIVTPHVAWASREAMQTLWDKLINNIEAFNQKQPINIVS